MYPIDHLWAAAARYGAQPAVLHAGGAISYRELAAAVVARAAGLIAAEPTPGGVVAVGADNDPRHLITILAVLAAGKVWVPLNPRNGDPELRRILEFVEPGLIVGDAAMAERLGGLGFAVRVIDGLLGGDSAGLPMGPRAAGAIDLRRAQAIKFTGGSTGVPKGVCQPLRAWNACIAAQVHHLRLVPGDRYLVSAPLTHGTSTYMLPFLAVGGALVFAEEARAPALLDAAARHRASVCYGPPTQILNLMEEQRRAPRDLSALRLVVYGSGPMRPEQIRAAQAVFGPIVGTCYGQTEAPQMISYLPPEEMHGAGLSSVGRACILSRVAILAPDGAVLPAGVEGEICVRGDLLMSGYHRDEATTAAVMGQGWLRTGDGGMIDESGLIHLRDRLKDVIISGGFNIFPADVETVLARHPAVLNCAVVGVADAHWGEAVHAAVEFRAGHRADAEELKALVRAELGAVKTPKQVHVFAPLPRNPVGKILKSAIREQIGRDQILESQPRVGPSA